MSTKQQEIIKNLKKEIIILKEMQTKNKNFNDADNLQQTIINLEEELKNIKFDLQKETLRLSFLSENDISTVTSDAKCEGEIIKLHQEVDKITNL